MTGANVLIAEAEELLASELKGIIEGLGYKVVGIARSSEESIRATKTLQPNVVLMNIRLKREKIITQTGSLIQDQYDVPIVYMVDYSSQDTIRRVGATGPFGYVFKPLNEKQILATIETALIRHQLEKRLEESRQWLNAILTSTGDGVIACDEYGSVRFINPVATELTGFHNSKALGRPVREVFIFLDEITREPKDLDGLKERKRISDPDMNFEGLLMSMDGRLMPIQLALNPIYDREKKNRGMVLAFRNITAQRDAMREIQLQASRAEALVKVATQLNKQIELETLLNRICLITNQTLKATGTAVFLLETREGVFRIMAAYSNDATLQTYKGVSFEFPKEVFESLLTGENPVVAIPDIQTYPGLPLLDSTVRGNISMLVLAGLFLQDRLIGALISVFRDDRHIISADDLTLLRGLAEQAASAIENAELFKQVRLGRERQQLLAKSLVDIQETERRHIARELHDQLGQALTGVQFMLENAKNQTGSEQRSGLEEIQRSISNLIEQIREMSLNLRPSMLDDMGLIPTLSWHFDRYTKQTGVYVNFQFDELPVRLPTEIETAAYRIIQEALTNVARYAQVKEVFVGLAWHENILWLEVVDKGRGFNLSKDLDRPSSGLGGMRERASMVGGYLFVKSYINQGTQIEAALPLTGKAIERRRLDLNRRAGR